MIIGWKAWFVDIPQQNDLTRFSSEQMDWEKLPQDGCLGVVLFYDTRKPDGNHHKGIHTGHDYYFKAGDIIGVDVDTRERNAPEDIRSRYQDPYIIRGIWTDDNTMARVNAEIAETQCR